MKSTSAFQSLLYWIRPSDQERWGIEWFEEPKFQSLLYWIRPSDPLPYG